MEIQEAWIRRTDCPDGVESGWVVVSYDDRGSTVRAVTTRAEAFDELERADRAAVGGFEGFARPADFPSPTSWVLVWRGDDFYDVHVRAFATRAEAMLALAALHEADPSNPQAAQRAAELRRFAVES